MRVKAIHFIIYQLIGCSCLLTRPTIRHHVSSHSRPTLVVANVDEKTPAVTTEDTVTSTDDMLLQLVDEDSILPKDAPLASGAFSVPVLVDEGDVQPPRNRALKVAGFNAALLSSTLTAVLYTGCAAAFLRAGPGQSVGRYLCAILPGLWDVYLKLVALFPVVTKSILTGATYVIGDMLAQIVQIRRTGEVTLGRSRAPRSSNPLLLMDPGRYLRSGLVGLVLLGPFAHFYYEGVAHFFDHWPVVLKILMDQTLYLASYNTVYFLVLGLLGARPFLSVVKKYREDFWSLLCAGWKLWPAIGIITYNFIPREHRVLFVDVVEIAYAAMLSSQSNHS